jgi:hypothetical protein
MPHMTIADWVGVLACAVALTAPACRADKAFKAIGLIAIGLWAPYYWLQGSMSGFAFTLLMGVRQAISMVSARLHPKVLTVALFGLLLAMTACAAVTWAGWHSLLPWAASVNGAYAYWYRSSVGLRVQLFAGDCAWLAYAAIVSAWPHAVFMAALICINLATIHRLRREMGVSPPQTAL